MTTLTTTRENVRRLLKDTDEGTPLLSDAELNQAIADALRLYSRDCPRLLTYALSGTGSAYDFAVSGWTGWIQGFSQVKAIEHPTGSQIPTYLPESDWILYLNSANAWQLRFYSTPVSGTNNILATYTAPHTHSESVDTVYAADYEALTWLSASQAALMMSAKMAASGDSAMAADSVNYRDGEARWRSVAKEYRARYDAFVKGDTTIGAASATADWDTQTSDAQDFTWHPRRRR